MNRYASEFHKSARKSILSIATWHGLFYELLSRIKVSGDTTTALNGSLTEGDVTYVGTYLLTYKILL